MSTSGACVSTCTQVHEYYSCGTRPKRAPSRQTGPTAVSRLLQRFAYATKEEGKDPASARSAKIQAASAADESSRHAGQASSAAGAASSSAAGAAGAASSSDAADVAS